jgi:hypothetical protein
MIAGLTARKVCASEEESRRTVPQRSELVLAFCYAGEMTGSLDQFVLIKASKSRGGVWSDDDYIVRDRARNIVIGRIMLPRKHRKTCRGFGR